MQSLCQGSKNALLVTISTSLQLHVTYDSLFMLFHRILKYFTVLLHVKDYKIFIHWLKATNTYTPTKSEFNLYQKLSKQNVLKKIKTKSFFEPSSPINSSKTNSSNQSNRKTSVKFCHKPYSNQHRLIILLNHAHVFRIKVA